ncbi:hypothetical protein [Bradyrhizobium cajani]|uniref:Uncharacterized protein n=1 Tax=Bradyrhizobium cajani TaxID=1928661 RepID=A0A844TCS0_9BRAD|nr:hypothetical protein [Bradyrhizobium cajani]MCP3367727.1 hypothetical protein [Bradyrhizobium cajani]MVT73774.1 hypothetical protein [Bradyrhizobium cajani]
MPRVGFLHEPAGPHTREQTVATEIAVANRDQPRNQFDAHPNKQDASTTQASSGELGGLGNYANRIGIGRPRNADDGDSGITNSGSYARNLPADAAFLKSVGLTDGTGRALAAMGFTSPEQVRQSLASDGARWRRPRD